MKNSQSIKRQEKLKLSDIKVVWSLLPENKRSKAIVLLVMMVVGMMLEMLGVGLVLPIIAILTDNSLAENYPFISTILDRFGNPSLSILLLAAMLILVLIYSIKNIYLAILSWRQTQFVFETQTEMAKILFRSYLHQPYIFHLQRNSAELINNLQVELNLFIVYMVSPGMLLITEALVVLGLVVLLFFIEPLGTAIVFSVFFAAGGTFQWLTKKRTTAWGKYRQLHESQRMKHIQQGLSAVKDVKLYGKEDFFLARYIEHTENSLRMNQRNSFVHNLTRYWLEVLAISGLALLLLGMLLQGKLIGEALPILGLFAAVSFRLMPSVSRIIGAIHQLRFGTAVTHLMQNEFNSMAADEHTTQNEEIWDFKKNITLKGISFTYPGSDRAALIEVNLTINKGEMVGFIGESGSGKSTLIDVILGLLKPTHGEVLVDSVDIHEDLRNWQSLIGYVPQSIYLTDDTLRRNIAFGLIDEEIDDLAVSQAALAAQLEKLVKELPDGLDTMLGERGVRLSGGQRQRIGIARALYNNPDILVLDEATSALDHGTESGVMQAIINLQGQKTILIIAHRLTTIEKCDVIFKVDHGALI